MGSRLTGVGWFLGKYAFGETNSSSTKNQPFRLGSVECGGLEEEGRGSAGERKKILVRGGVVLCGAVIGLV
jgi:hypothetical protein